MRTHYNASHRNIQPTTSSDELRKKSDDLLHENSGPTNSKINKGRADADKHTGTYEATSNRKISILLKRLLISFIIFLVEQIILQRNNHEVHRHRLRCPCWLRCRLLWLFVSIWGRPGAFTNVSLSREQL